jgi:uncharacterized protein YndB with AHSA1/START domain
MTEPLIVEFEVRAPIEHAFDMWANRCALWWPPSHTVSGDPQTIVCEPHRGGRIFERAPDGAEHDWGEVLDWEPPTRLRYLWHLFFDRSEATEVEVTFSALDDRTGVRLAQHGWDRLGDVGAPRRTRTRQVWGSITPLYAQACEATPAHG